MKVKELIEELEKSSPETEVEIALETDPETSDAEIIFRDIESHSNIKFCSP